MRGMRPVLITTLLLAVSASSAWAEKADRNKPMNVEADSLRHDELKQISVFTGRVLLTKGTLILRGGRAEVRQDASGYQYGTLQAEDGQRAFFRQKREGVDEYMEGEAEVIEYDGRADQVRLLRRAELRRYLGATLNDEISGSTITYDNLTEVFKVDGQVSQPGAGAGRVKAVLTPRPVASAAPATPAGAGKPEAAALRSSPSLTGERR